MDGAKSADCKIEISDLEELFGNKRHVFRSIRYSSEITDPEFEKRALLEKLRRVRWFANMGVSLISMMNSLPSSN